MDGDFLKIAKRCEQSDSNSWDLDREIFKATGALPEIWFGSKVISWFGEGPFGCNTEDGIRHLDCINAPNYTASVDVAMTLIPKGIVVLDLTLSWDTLEPQGSPACSVRWYPRDHSGKGWHAATAPGKTAALAVCNAALQMRARTK